jgi:hypothetical protein
MGIQTKRKLNWLQHSLPEGLLVDSAWLEKHGYSRALRKKYVENGWLEQMARGLYRRPAPKLLGEGTQQDLPWQAVVISLQTLLACPYTVGGRTALELQGFAHYLSSGTSREVHLYGSGKIPGWVLKLKLNTRFVFHNSEKLFKNTKRHDADALQQNSTTVQPWGHWEWPLRMSTPERAILELLAEVPEQETFHQADMLMEGLSNLSPHRVQMLLVACHSVKVKRLFLWFAERHQHAWLKKVDRNSIDLGHGKRMLVRGGKLDPTFNITVPESLDAGK